MAFDDHINGIIKLDWDVNTEQIVLVRKENILARYNEVSHVVWLRLMDGETVSDPTGLSATMFFIKASGTVVTINASIQTISDYGKVFNFTLPDNVCEQGSFRMYLRIELNTTKRTVMIVDGNVL